MENIYNYQVKVTWQAERRGILESLVLDSRIEVATPPEFPKGVEGIWSPEHLFVAALNSCFMTTFLSVAENSKLEFINFECEAIGKLEKIDGKFMISEIILNPILTLATENEKGLRVLEMSEKACLISNSVKTSIKLQPQIRIEG
jgi:organic hydroperoxide reductase OsmC/OhrA